VDKSRIPREFKVGKHVFLKVKPKKNSLNLGSCTKLASRYCGPFEILDNIGLAAYMFALRTTIKVHNVFHVSSLKKYMHDPYYIFDWSLI
jgi:hypothetical protein